MEVLILVTISNGSETAEMAVRAGWIGLRKPLRSQPLGTSEHPQLAVKAFEKAAIYCHFGRFFRGVVDLEAGLTFDTVSSISLTG